MSAPSPTVIAGRYELQRRLATGGMAEVWLAIDLTLDRKVAVKWLKPALATDEIVAERFRREAVAAASLNHPNIVAVHDVFEQDGRQAVVMQLVDGKSLRQLLDNQKRLSPELTCHIGQAVAGALDHAHQAGFVHRDVKPGNIMITPDGRVLLTDFGIAKGLQGEHGQDLTSDNIMMGTAKYLSPEQVRGRRLDGRADLYSLGLVLYECLAGRVPFLGETDADTALARLQRDPTDLARLRATLPRTLVVTIHELLARSPERRPATGADLIERLRRAAEEGPPEIDATNPPRSPVAPFAAGRMVRAPSDLQGRSDDRVRGARTPTPPRGRTGRSNRRAPSHPTPRPVPPRSPSGPVGIPGEPPTVTSPPIDAADVRPPRADVTDDGDAVAPSPPVRDATPATGTPLRGAPARGMAGRLRPSATVVSILLLVAAGVAVVLWLTITYGGSDTTPTTTVLPGAEGEAVPADSGDGAAPESVTEGAGTSAGAGQPGGTGGATTPDGDGSAAPVGTRIADVGSFDPDGDGAEQEGLAVAALADGDGSTEWRTECYSDRFMGAKRGTGLVVSFDAPLRQALRFDVDSAPSNVFVYASADDEAPTSFEAWGDEVRRAASTEPGTVTFEPETAVRHVLVSMVELGPDPGCSDSNPYRGILDEIALVGT